MRWFHCGRQWRKSSSRRIASSRCFGFPPWLHSLPVWFGCYERAPLPHLMENAEVVNSNVAHQKSSASGRKDNSNDSELAAGTAALRSAALRPAGSGGFQPPVSMVLSIGGAPVKVWRL